MTPIRLRLAGWVLSLYADGQVSRNCDDLDWPEWFPVAEREPLVRDMERANGGRPEDVADSVEQYTTGSACPPAWWLAAFFAEAMGYAE